MSMSKKVLVTFLIIVFALAFLVSLSANSIFDVDHASKEMPLLPREVYIEAEIWRYASSRAETMDVSMYALSEDEVTTMLDEIVAKASRLLSTSLRYNLVIEDEYVKTISFSYRDSSRYSARSQEVAAEIDRILSVVDESMTDLEKALAVNDYFCLNYSYDTTYSIYTMEELFENKTGVCQAYALAYYYILNDCLNIESAFVPSDSMNHIWNAVKIDGEWYHVDVTWNDPVADLPGRACHDYFMKSSFVFEDSRHNHYGWCFKDENYWSDENLDIECLSKTYDDYFWDDISSQILMDDEYYYYLGYVDGTNIVDDGCIIKRDKFTGETSNLFTITDIWRVWNSNYIYVDKFSSILPYDDMIVVNTIDMVYVIDHNGVIKQKYDISSDRNKKSIYHLQISGNELTCLLSRDYDAFGIEDTITFKLSPTNTVKFDINGDREVSFGDINLFSEYFAGWSRYFNILNVDLNGDGKLNRLDLLLFAQGFAD